MPSRRRMLQMLGALGVVGAGGWALLGGTRANAYYQGPVSDHFDGVRFFNPGGVGPRGRLALPAAGSSPIAARHGRRAFPARSRRPAAGALRGRGGAHRLRRPRQRS